MSDRQGWILIAAVLIVASQVGRDSRLRIAYSGLAILLLLMAILGVDG